MIDETDPKTPNRRRQNRFRRARRRDFFALTAGFIGLILILALSGAIGSAEAVVSVLIFTSASLAYFLATSESWRIAEFMSDQADTTLSSGEAMAGRSDLSAISNLISAFPSPTFFMDNTGRIVVANAFAVTLFRLPTDRSILATTALRRPDLLSALTESLERQVENQLEIRLSGDQEQVYLCQISPVSVHQSSYVLCTLTDLTAVKRAEKARADFLANASHELRTPLTSLSGFIETMRGPAKDDVESWDKFLEIMSSQTERMRRLIHDLLSLSRIELNEHRRPDEVIDFNAIITETVEAMRPVAEERAVKIDLSTPATTILVRGNRDELSQVAQNLIDNATKYSQPGSTIKVTARANQTIDEAKAFASRQWPDAARLSIITSSDTLASDYAVLRVEDEGRGIPREHLPRLGERFYRIDEGRDRLVGGTGLGLAIVKHITSRHRGSFQVESTNGRGSAFSIVLPQPHDAKFSENISAEAAE